jgi:hypothetical protein
MKRAGYFEPQVAQLEIRGGGLPMNYFGDVILAKPIIRSQFAIGYSGSGRMEQASEFRAVSDDGQEFDLQPKVITAFLVGLKSKIKAFAVCRARSPSGARPVMPW